MDKNKVPKMYRAKSIIPNVFETGYFYVRSITYTYGGTTICCIPFL